MEINCFLSENLTGERGEGDSSWTTCNALYQHAWLDILKRLCGTCAYALAHTCLRP